MPVISNFKPVAVIQQQIAEVRQRSPGGTNARKLAEHAGAMTGTCPAQTMTENRVGALGLVADGLIRANSSVS